MSGGEHPAAAARRPQDNPVAWSPDSWRRFPLAQAPGWPDEGRLKAAVGELEQLPPLVEPGESRRLAEALSAVVARRAFVLQAGDCSESFAEVTADAIRAKLSVILQMGVVLAFGAGLPTVKIGRLAGQFAKPRTSPTERLGADELPAFRGHMVNDDAFDAAARTPDPARMVLAYRHSAVTLNVLRALEAGGFSSLRKARAWAPAFLGGTDEGRRYEQTADEVDRALSFLGACGVPADPTAPTEHAEIFTSHEALVLDYEQALTRREPADGRYYDGSAHFVWVGDRTRASGGAHVEFVRGLANPVGLKVGPSARPGEVVELCRQLNPDRVPGRLSVITRLGRSRVEELLVPIVEAVESAGEPVVWQCDPMHGNTIRSEGRKTRRFDDLLGELASTFAVHRRLGSFLGGIHVELTGDDVTECLGGSGEISEASLSLRYTTTCDPRLNARQALDLAFKVAELLRP